MDENVFLCGIDFGNEYTCISYWNYSCGKPQTIDVSGGYAFESLPSAAAYIPEYGEWVLGEYALNETSENAVFFKDIVKNIGKDIFYNGEKIKIHNKELLAMLVSEIIAQIKNVNPNSRIFKLTVSISEGIGEKEKKELIYAFEKNGISREKLIFESQIKCALRYFLENEKEIYNKICFLDFGSSAVKITKAQRDLQNGGFKIKTKIFDDISARYLDKQLYLYFFKILKNEKENISEAEMKGLEIFTRGHKNAAFKNSSSEYVNLYYSFCYPPFKKKVLYSDINEVVKKTLERLAQCLKEFVSEDGFVYILSGGVFEQNDFKNEFIKKAGINSAGKMPKAICSLGAALISAERYGIASKKEINIENKTLDFDIGVKADKFIPILECGSFALDRFYSKCFVIPEEISEGFEIDIYKREKNKAEELYKSLRVSDFPKRKKGGAKIKIALKYTENDVIETEISDMGFGEFYGKTGYIVKDYS